MSGRRVAAGELTQRITLQAPSSAIDSLGQRIEDWDDVITLSAKAQPLRDREFFAAGAVQSDASICFVIRWRNGINRAMRVLWRSHAYALIAKPIDIDGGRHTLELMCAGGDVIAAPIGVQNMLDFSKAANSQYLLRSVGGI